MREGEVAVHTVMVTGLAVLDYAKFGGCRACNYDFGWMVLHPSVVLWADRILVTPHLREAVSHWAGGAQPLYAGIAHVFDTLEAAGVLQTRDPSKVVTKAWSDRIFEQVDRDRELLAESFPAVVRVPEETKTPGEIFVGGEHYCRTHVHAMYVSLLLARHWGATCLFDPPAYNYLRHRMGVRQTPAEGSEPYAESFQTVFDTCVPDVPLLGRAGYCGEDCRDCPYREDCRDVLLSRVDENVPKLLQYRDRDEIHQLRRELRRIVRAAGTMEDMTPKKVLQELRSRAAKLNRRIAGVFPKVRRWTNLLTTVSVPFAVTGLAVQSALLTVSSAAAYGLAEMTSAMLGRLESEAQWVAFLNAKPDHPSPGPDEEALAFVLEMERAREARRKGGSARGRSAGD